jgi:hypothetical protein
MNLDIFGLTDNEYVILQALHATISKTPLTRKDYWSFEGGRRDVHLTSPVYSHRQGRYVYPLTDKTISKLLSTERKLTWSYEPLVGAYIDVEGSNERYGVLVSGDAATASYILAKQSSPSGYHYGAMGKTYVIGCLVELNGDDMREHCSAAFYDTCKVYRKIIQEYVPEEGDITLMDIPKPHELLAVAGGFGTYPDIPDPFESAKSVTNRVAAIEQPERVEWIHPEAKKTILSWMRTSLIWVLIPLGVAIAAIIAGILTDGDRDAIAMTALLTAPIEILAGGAIYETYRYFTEKSMKKKVARNVLD